MESTVLFGVQYLQQSRCGVAIICISRHLVYLVKDKDRVAGTGFLYVLYDTPRERSHIRAAMTAYLCLVMQTAKAHANVLSLQGIGDTLTKRGLSHSRRTVKTQDRRLQIAAQLKDCDILQYALLNLFHAVVVAVQYALRSVQVQVILCIFAPREVNDLLQVCQLRIVVGTVDIQLVQALHFLIENSFCLLGPFLFLCFLQQCLFLGAAFIVAQLLVDILQLLAQEVFALLIVDGMLCLVVDIQPQISILYLPVEQLQQVKCTHLHVIILQQPHLLREFEGHVV